MPSLCAILARKFLRAPDFLESRVRGSKCPESVRARIMSLDAVMPYVDDERGARARLEQLHEATCTHYEKMLQEWRDRNDDE